MEKEAEKKLLSFIESYCGLTINEAHKNFMNLYVKRRLSELSLTLDKYFNLIQRDSQELEELINEAAINETYFFREEQQFDFLREHYLPRLSSKNVRIWSAACSTGEEAISLYALCSSMGFIPEVYATDIDTAAMNVLKKGIYSTNSFRSDGKKYMHLLDLYGEQKNGIFTLNRETASQIHIEKYNLSEDQALPLAPESVDIIFLRNVFIYFTPELREKIIQRLSAALKPGGLLFLSINEIASVECREDSPLTKEHTGSVYYFIKEDGLKHKKKNTLKHEQPRPLPVKKAKPVLPVKPEIKKDSTHSMPQSRPSVPQTKDHEPAAPESQSQKQQSIQELYLHLQTLLETGAVHEAASAVETYRFRAEQAEYRHFFTALIYKANDKKDMAIDSLSKAYVANPAFWPARFEAGTLLMQTGNKEAAKKELSVCKEKIRDYIKDQKMCYNFLTEQFSPAYFLTLCDNIIRTI